MYSIYLKPPKPQAPRSYSADISEHLEIPGYEQKLFPNGAIWATVEPIDGEYMMWRALSYVGKTRALAAREQNQLRQELLLDRAEKQRLVAERIAEVISFEPSSDIGQEFSWVTGASANLSLVLEEDRRGTWYWRSQGPDVPVHVFEPIHSDVEFGND